MATAKEDQTTDMQGLINGCSSYRGEARPSWAGANTRCERTRCCSLGREPRTRFVTRAAVRFERSMCTCRRLIRQAATNCLVEEVKKICELRAASQQITSNC